MRYRDHRGSLAESLSTTQTFNKIKDIMSYLNKRAYKYFKSVDIINFKYVGFDERCGWDTYYVSARFKGEREFYVVGMSDEKYKIPLSYTIRSWFRNTFM